MTDAGGSFAGVAAGKAGREAVVADHDTVVHSNQEYVRGIVHSNSVEGFNVRIRRTVAGVFHHIDPKHYDGYFDEMAFRWSQRVYLGTANRHTRKGKLVARMIWDRVPLSEQMRVLLAGAVGRRMRRTRHWGVEIVPRQPIARPAAIDAASIGSLLDDEIPF
jgi:hypothetical protein